MAAVSIELLRKSARQASELLKVLGNQHRLLIMCHLLDGEKQVSELQSLIGLSQSALSQHLARLRHEGLVQTRRASQAIYYSLVSEEAKQIIAVLYELYCAPKTTRKKTRKTPAVASGRP